MKLPSLKTSLAILALSGLGVFSSLAVADWVAKDANGANIIFDAVTNGTKIIPKFVQTDSTGVPIGTDVNPVVTTLSSASPPTVSATQSGSWIMGATQSGAWSVTPVGTWSVSQGSPPWAMTQSGPWTVGQSGTWNVGLNTGSNTIGAVTQSGGPWGLNLAQVGGSSVSPANPLPAQIIYNGAPVTNTAAGSLPINCVTGCSAVSSSLASYSAANTWVVSASPTDIATLQGSDTKTIKVRRVLIAGTNGTPNNSEVSLTRRTSANTGGTSSAPTIAKMDSTDPNPTAVFKTYTINPSPLGTDGGTLKVLFFGAVGPSTTNNPSPSQTYSFGELNSKPIVLRGSSDFLAFNMSSGGASNSMKLSIDWTEE